MTQAMYAYMNNKTIKILKRKRKRKKKTVLGGEGGRRWPK
jgi:hypothetical protein